MVANMQDAPNDLGLVTLPDDFDLAALPNSVKPAVAPPMPPNAEAPKPTAEAAPPERMTVCVADDSLAERQVNLLIDQAGVRTREALRKCSGPIQADTTLYEQGGTSVKWHRVLGAKLRIQF